MSFSTKLIRLFFLSFLGGFLFTGTGVLAQGVTLYTPYKKVVASPGETLKYSIEVNNRSDSRQNVDISVSGMPGEWTYDLTAGTWKVKQLALLPKGKKSLTLKVNVPYKVKKGTYRFKVVAGSYVLPLYVEVSKQGNYKTEFTCRQTNMQGNSKANFTFSTELKNVTGEKQRYALQAAPPAGWIVLFKPNYKQATSVEIEPNNKVNMTIEIKPPREVSAGTYDIPVRAVSGNTSAQLTLEVVITGNFEMELTTPTGLLSTKITAGDEKKVTLVVKNTGSATLKDIKFRKQVPAKWEVSFDPKNIADLMPGKTAEVTATIKAYKKAVTGDYVVKLTAYTPEVSSQVAFRVLVKTPFLMGWIGILVILLAVGTVYYLFRKYGRR